MAIFVGHTNARFFSAAVFRTATNVNGDLNMAEDNLPTAIWSGSFWLLGVEVKCHTLSDGRRIIEADSMVDLFDAKMNDGPQPDTDEMKKFSEWQRGQ